MMAVDQIRTSDVALGRQYDQWRHAVSSTHQPWDMPPRRDGAYDGSVRRLRLGMGQVLSCVCDPCTGRRGAIELARTSIRRIGVLFVVAGRERLAHRHTDTFLEAGQFTLWDTAQPLSFEVPERLEKLTLVLPPALVLPALPSQEVPLGRRFDATEGCGALLLAQLKTLAALQAPLDPTGTQAAIKSALDLLAAAVLSQSTGPTTAGQRVVAKAEHHILGRLAEPALSVADVAEALGMSRRRLDRAFAEQGRTVARFIRDTRLERCRRDLLLDPDTSISEVAFRWGFNDAAHFSRSFRGAFGCSPRAYRARGAAGPL